MYNRSIHYQSGPFTMKKSRRAFIIFAVLLLSIMAGAAFGGEMLKPGDAAPAVTAKNYQGQTVKLADLAAEGPVVLVFARGFG
jgi:hypothetical protein